MNGTVAQFVPAPHQCAASNNDLSRRKRRRKDASEHTEQPESLALLFEIELGVHAGVSFCGPSDYRTRAHTRLLATYDQKSSVKR